MTKPVKFKWYLVTLWHDRGTWRLRVPASTKKAARQVVLLSELCPERAIKKVKRLK
jgi:hypothetical protein